MPAISGAQVKEAAKTFRLGHAVGTYNIRPRHMSIVADAAADAMAAILTACERLAAVPSEATFIVFPNAGGGGCVGVLRALFANHEAVRFLLFVQ